TKARISSFDELFDAAMAVKLASAQINEIVHAVGIIKTLPIILDDDEIITNLSLASGAEGSGFDLETNKRVAEFKFAKWQDGSANGMRKRQVFSDLANLTILKTDKKKELYVVSYDKVIRYLNGKANWTNALSKSGNIKLKLGLFLNEINRPE